MEELNLKAMCGENERRTIQRALMDLRGRVRHVWLTQEQADLVGVEFGTRLFGSIEVMESDELQ